MQHFYTFVRVYMSLRMMCISDFRRISGYFIDAVRLPFEMCACLRLAETRSLQYFRFSTWCGPHLSCRIWMLNCGSTAELVNSLQIYLLHIDYAEEYERPEYETGSFIHRKKMCKMMEMEKMINLLLNLKTSASCFMLFHCYKIIREINSHEWISMESS